MEWISDTSAGDWLRDRLDAGGTDMHVVVPHGYPAYARIFHPASVRSLPDRAVPTYDEWEKLSGVEQQHLLENFKESDTTWQQTAAAFGSTFHPTAQWQHLVKTPPETDWNTRISPDGREFTSPEDASLSPSDFARLSDILAAHTTTPDEGYAAIWGGFGGLLGFFGDTPSRATLIMSDNPVHERMLGQSIRDRFNNPFRKAVWQPGILSDEISKGPRLELPDREYVLFSAAPSGFADPDWILDAPWRDRPQEAQGFAPQAQHPNLVWPADHAWIMVSEIDYDSTVIGGSAELIAAICAAPSLEALPITEGTALHWDADTINA